MNQRSNYLSSSTPSENPALQRLFNLQAAERKKWKGIVSESTGIPGIPKKKFVPITELQTKDDASNKLIDQLLDKLAELESRTKKSTQKTSQSNFGSNPSTTTSGDGYGNKAGKGSKQYGDPI